MMKKAALLAAVFLFFAVLPFSPAAGADTDTAAVKAMLKAYVEGRYHWSDVRIEDLVLAGGGVSGLRQPGLPTDIEIVKDPPGRTVFKLGFADGGKTEATAQVTAFTTVVKAKRLLGINSAIGPDDVYSAKEDVSRVEEGSFIDASALVGGWLTCSVGPGVTILKQMVSFSPLVKRGQKVNIVIDSPAFRITATGEILQDTRVGSYAKVMNLSSKKMLSGYLADVDTVRIQAEDIR
ncbi:MAG: flagellar basal body P-ring formation chaperone FlgA [Nitrospiraceae bacterium]|nr:flagellar basal body P-ring formation chaperone FlgA [Nitrospiraceae bacterium]